MFWPDSGTGVDVEPTRKPVAAAVRKFFTEGGVGVPPTVPGGDWFNQITNELLNVLAAAGIDPSKVDDDQLLAAIKNISNAGNSREALRRSLGDAGYDLVSGSFELGGTVTDPSDVLLYQSTSKAYRWDGVFPEAGKSVPAGSTPDSMGGVGPGLWRYVSLELLRKQLTSQGQSINEIAMQSVRHHSGRISYASLPRLIRAFVNYNDATALVIQVLGLGSSVGNGASLPDPATQAPVAYLTSLINGLFNKLGNKNITAHNRSVNGSTLTDGVGALESALAEPLTPKLTVLAFGMNDGNTAIYNAGQTLPFVYTRCVEIIEKAKAAGSDVIVLTSPHPHSGRISWSMPAGNPQVYPISVPAPVSDEALVPSASNSIKHIDATGDGTIIPVSYRHMRVNEAMRRAAADCGCPVIDAEWYWFKAVALFGEDALFNPGEWVHPNLLGHQLSYWAAERDFVESLTASVISGNQQIDFMQRAVAGLSSGQTPLARNHFRQSAINTNEAVARIDTSDGTRGLVLDAQGNLAPVDTFNGEWVLPRVVHQRARYAATSIYFDAETITSGGFNLAAAITVPIVAEGAFELSVKAAQSGIPPFWQWIKVHGYNKGGSITLAQDWTQGGTIVNITASGSNVVITPVAANTDIHYKLECLHL
jgi:hypothetical protein